MAGLTWGRGGSLLPKGRALLCLKEATTQSTSCRLLWSPMHPQVSSVNVPTGLSSPTFHTWLLGGWETSKELLGLCVRGSRVLHLLQGRHWLLLAFLGVITGLPLLGTLSTLSEGEAGAGRRWGGQAVSCIPESS